MENTHTLKRDLELVGWGVFFLWWGVMEFAEPVHGLGYLGLGVILLGLNVARWRGGVGISYFSFPLGLVLLALGVVVLGRTLTGLPRLELDVFPILLITVGLMFLVREMQHTKGE